MYMTPIKQKHSVIAGLTRNPKTISRRLRVKPAMTIFCLLIGLISCKQNTQATTESKTQVAVPELNADSAYIYTEKQVAFGPRVPNTPAHEACKQYFVDEFQRFGAEVTEQKATLYTYNSQAIQATNIIASFQPETKNRILLCAHWDSRPFADQDTNPANHHKAIDGANDGAGACGILLEIARQIGQQQPSAGIDIILFDAEDWGTPEFDRAKYGSTGWCLGSKYWAQHPHIPNYTAQFGILLDMASGKEAQFYKEYFSLQYARKYVNKVWDTAQALGYGNYFINRQGGGVEDDHRQVFEYRHIPCLDIIQTDAENGHSFGSYWHTLDDNMDAVSKETMKAVGQTVLAVVYSI
ncbi:glutamine cyclotransferase [Bacteroidia bacterium]|nr:glutamine cyclotransferase [Bacteroidia bacterium]